MSQMEKLNSVNKVKIGLKVEREKTNNRVYPDINNERSFYQPPLRMSLCMRNTCVTHG